MTLILAFINGETMILQVPGARSWVANDCLFFLPSSANRFSLF